MATSGLVGRSNVTVAFIIDEAFRRCGKQASTVSGEQVLSARTNLFMLCAALANRGLSLWCVQKYVLGVLPLKTTFQLPSGSVDLLNALYRTTTALTGSTISGAGYRGLQLSTADFVYTVGVRFTAAATVNLVVESSDDNVTWVERAQTPTDSVVATGEWLYQDVDNTAEALYWRLRSTNGTLPTVQTLTFANDPNEIPMAKINRDDYTALPNKTFSASEGSYSLQYWYDKQTTPRMWIWPVSQDSVDQIVVWVQRQIQDVGSLSNTLDVPQRWLEGIIMLLASRVALILPASEVPQDRVAFLTAEADKYLTEAEDGESDGSSSRYAPNLAPYTS